MIVIGLAVLQAFGALILLLFGFVLNSIRADMKSNRDEWREEWKQMRQSIHDVANVATALQAREQLRDMKTSNE